MSEKKKRQSKYPPYAQAKQMALELQLSSRSAYQKWHKDTKCEYLPGYPERVYKDWVSWNDYLGTANVFKGEVQKPLRPFWDAVKFAHEKATVHNLNTMAEWLEYWKSHTDELPNDVPLRPDQRYVEWNQLGWKGWLGTDMRGRMLAAKQSTALLAICSIHNLSKPGNVYALIQAEKGEVDLMNTLDRARDLVPVRVYKLPPDLKEATMDTVRRFTPKDQQGSYEGIFLPQIADLLFELDMILMIHRLQPKKPRPVEPITEAMMFPPSVYKHRVG